MKTGAVFDLDGTLLDSAAIWNGFAERYLLSVGFAPPKDICKTVADMSLPQAADYFIRECGLALSKSEILFGIKSLLKDFYQNEAALFPGVKDFLRRLDDLGVSMCVATACDGELAEAALSKTGVMKYFTAILPCGKFGAKTEPDIFRRAAKLLQTEKQNTAVFDDSPAAIKTARQDGFLTVFVGRKSAEREIKADFILKDFNFSDEIISFFERKICREPK